MSRRTNDGMYHPLHRTALRGETPTEPRLENRVDVYRRDYSTGHGVDVLVGINILGSQSFEVGGGQGTVTVPSSGDVAIGK